MRARAWSIVMLVVAACGGAGGDAGEVMPAEERVTLHDGLGTLTRPVDTEVVAAQQFFDQGLRLDYAFNHAESIRSFREAQRLDPECAMCWWGEALAWGPNINAAMDSASGVAAYAAVQKALSLSAGAGEVERGMIEALSRRYAAEPGPNQAVHDSAYAAAMGSLVNRYPQDDDIAVLYAEALMNLSPWDYWIDRETPKPTGAATISNLERVLVRNPDHPGACHYYIHSVEAMQPQKAVACAERLPELMPAAGHIVHMPAHVYVRVGRYADAVERNVHATHADEAILGDIAPDGVYRLGYVPHNFHFLSFAADMAGMSARAIESANGTAAAVDTTLMRVPDLVALQHFRSMPLYTWVRFGRWDEILAAPAPPSDLPYMQGVWHFGRALALVRAGRIDEAGVELDALGRAKDDPSLASLKIWGINSPGDLLAIADDIAAGEVAAARKAWPAAIVRLRSAQRREDALTYDEPPTWQLPVRHYLGAILLEAGRAEEAEAVYREDLDRFPANGWSLIGLRIALEAQNRMKEAELIARQFQAAWAGSDVVLTASRF